MKMKTTGMMAAVSLCALAGVAQAQLTLAFDINGFDYHFKDGGGATSFGGDGHTGTVDWSYATSPDTTIADTRIGTGGQFGSFSGVALGAHTLTGFSGSLTLLSGDVVSGSFIATLSNGDTYKADVYAGSITDLGGQYVLTGKTEEGEFSDFDWAGAPAPYQFGDIDVTEWYDRQANPGELFGSLFKFRFPGTATGNGDMEIFVMVPLPPAAYAGLGMLAGVMGLSYVLRRR